MEHGSCSWCCPWTKFCFVKPKSLGPLLKGELSWTTKAWRGCSLEGHSAWLEGQSGHQRVPREMSTVQPGGGQVTSRAAGPG